MLFLVAAGCGKSKAAGGPKDCRSSPECKQMGNCESYGEICVPASQADCDQAVTCGGRARDGSGPAPAAPSAPGAEAAAAPARPSCEFDAEQRRCETQDCWYYGRCSNKTVATNVEQYGTTGEMDVETTSYDVPGTDTDCATAEVCKRDHACHVSADGSSCTPNDDDCKQFPTCASDGNCSAMDGTCKPGKESDCADSSVCKDKGLCSYAGYSCVATSDEICRAAPVCAREGRCAKSATGNSYWCVSYSDDDCLASENCKKEGMCTRVFDAGCQAEGKDCKKSEACKKEGRCKADPSSHTCVK